MSIYDQGRIITRAGLRTEIEEALSNMVPGDGRHGPDMVMLRKADAALDRIMALVDQYARK